MSTTRALFNGKDVTTDWLEDCLFAKYIQRGSEFLAFSYNGDAYHGIITNQYIKVEILGDTLFNESFVQDVLNVFSDTENDDIEIKVALSEDLKTATINAYFKAMKENICDKCTFYTKDGRCNRLVYTCIGMNDITASRYKKDNKCDYFEQGNSNRDRVLNSTNFYNS